MIRGRDLAILGSLVALTLVASGGPVPAQSTCQQDCFDTFNTDAGQCDASCAGIQDPVQRRNCVRQCVEDANQQYRSCISVASCNGPSSFPCAPTRCPAEGRYADGTCQYLCDFADSPDPDMCVERCMDACSESYQACVNDAFAAFPCKFDDIGTCLGCDECCGALEFCDSWYSYSSCHNRCREECGLQ